MKLADLTVRQRQIIRLLAQGLSNREIAQKLRVAVPTVKNHLTLIARKTRIRGIGQNAKRRWRLVLAFYRLEPRRR